MKRNQDLSARSKYADQLCVETKAPTSETQVKMDGCFQPQSILTSPCGLTGNRIIGVTINEKGRTTSVHKGNTVMTNGKPEKSPVEISVGLLSDSGEVWMLNIGYLGGRVFATRDFIAYDNPDESDFVVMGE